MFKNNYNVKANLSSKRIVAFILEKVMLNIEVLPNKTENNNHKRSTNFDRFTAQPVAPMHHKMKERQLSNESIKYNQTRSF